jgi:UDP-2,4-diacetamido-2,4,6-trideoxy-beta-L-altropyranose hydrolase
MKKNIIIRADGGTSIGMGHVVRCLALAEMLKDDFVITFVIQSPADAVLKVIHQTTKLVLHLPETDNFEQDAIHFSEFLKGDEIVVLDGYNFKTEYQSVIKKKGCKLVAIDDLHDWQQLADVIINHADGADKKDYSAEAYTRFCLGLDYILLRKEFLNTPFREEKIKTVSRFFISMGAADEHNNTSKFAEALLQIDEVKEVHLMLSTINPHIEYIKETLFKDLRVHTHFNLSAKEIVDLLKKIDVVICPASSISLESCAVGVGLISGYTAENQLGNLNGLAKHKTLINFGDINSLSVMDIKNKIMKLIPYPTVFNELINNQIRMIDRKSPERLLDVFKKLN